MMRGLITASVVIFWATGSFGAMERPAQSPEEAARVEAAIRQVMATSPGSPTTASGAPAVPTVAAASTPAAAAAPAAAPAQFPTPTPPAIPNPGAVPPIPGAGAAAMPAAAQAAAPAALPAAAPAAPRTLWTFLGFPSAAQCAACKETLKSTPLVQAIHTYVTDPMLSLVGLKPGPPPLDSPAALASPTPAVQVAAQVKAQEDAAPAKIAAIQYLATIDCLCYPNVSKALLAATEDCTEAVRFEAVKALGRACCCSKEVSERLDEIANKRDEFGNYKEWSARVRQAAVQARLACLHLIAPEKEPVEAAPEPGEAAPVPVPPPVTHAPTTSQPAVASATRKLPDRTGDSAMPAHHVSDSQIKLVLPDKTMAAAVQNPVATRNVASKGAVSAIDPAAGLVHITFGDGEVPPLGTRLGVHHRYPLKRVYLGDVEIVDIAGNVGSARPLGTLSIKQIKKGDQAQTITK